MDADGSLTPHALEGPDFGESGNIRIARNGLNVCGVHASPRAPVQALPTAWDWRTLGAVTPIVNQGEVGRSMWVLCADAATEH